MAENKSNKVLEEEILALKKKNKELKESLELLETALAGADLGTWSYDLKTDVVSMDHNAEKILGYKPKTNSEWNQYVHPDDVEKKKNVDSATVNSRSEAFASTYRIATKTGEIKWILDRGKTVQWDKNGKPARAAGTICDITKKKKEEEELEKSRVQMELALTSGNLAWWEWDLLTGKVTYHRSEEVMTFTADYLDEYYEKGVHPDDKEKSRKIDERLINGEIEVYDLEYRIITDSGDVKWIADRGKVIEWDKKGKPLRISGISQDITARKLAEEAFRENAQRLEIALNAADLGMWDWNEETGEVVLNEKAVEILGNKIKFGSEWDLIVHPEDRRRVYEAEYGDYKIRNLFESEYRIVTKSGTVKWIYDRGKIIEYNKKGRPSRTTGILQDITERKTSELMLQQAKKLEIIGTLAGGVAHDLNNILSGIIGYPGLLLMKLPETSPLRKYVLAIEKSGEKAATIVHDLLTLARRGLPITEVVNLNQTIFDCLESPEHEKVVSYYPEVQIETNFETGLLNIHGSPAHLSETIMNLISNAAEAMQDGGKISISTENRYMDRRYEDYKDIKEGDYVVVTISDTGTGISEEDVKKIFEPFYTKKKLGRSGTGLGMAVVRGTIKDHNGYIDVQSKEGAGTTFILYFPATTEKMTAKKILSSTKEYMGNKESILVVDDMKVQRDMVSEILETLGYSVASVSSGEEAVDYLKTNSVDLLVLDMIMDPGIDGLDTYKQVLKLHPEQKAIITTGYSEHERLMESKCLGIKQVLKKPYGIEKIAMAVKSAIKGQNH
ncbi:MAG: PAS domain-containing protein [Desulfobacterales bacterium]|nr:PAS domain-containing protein [Desulfobacterales bacterium]